MNPKNVHHRNSIFQTYTVSFYHPKLIDIKGAKVKIEGIYLDKVKQGKFLWNRVGT